MIGIFTRTVGFPFGCSISSRLRELFADLEETYPGFADGIVTKQGAVHRFVNLYVNDEDARYIGSLDARIEDGDTVSILPAVAGGQARAGWRRTSTT